jgi:hypothetical protein
MNSFFSDHDHQKIDLKEQRRILRKKSKGKTFDELSYIAATFE